MTGRPEKMVGPVSLKAPQSFFDKIDAWRAGQRLEAVQKAEKPKKGGKA
jgi:hypothetical protein